MAHDSALLSSPLPSPAVAAAAVASSAALKGRWSIGLEQRSSRDIPRLVSDGSWLTPEKDSYSQLQYVHVMKTTTIEMTMKMVMMLTMSIPTHSYRYGLGLGSDCAIPCATEADCIALYGAGYSLSSLPSVKMQKCSYLRTRTQINTAYQVSPSLPGAAAYVTVPGDNATVEIEYVSSAPQTYACSLRSLSHAQTHTHTHTHSLTLSLSL